MPNPLTRHFTFLLSLALLAASRAASARVASTTLGNLASTSRAITVADQLQDGRVHLAKWIRRLTNWNGRQATQALWAEKLAPLVAERSPPSGSGL